MIRQVLNIPFIFFAIPTNKCEMLGIPVDRDRSFRLGRPARNTGDARRARRKRPLARWPWRSANLHDSRATPRIMKEHRHRERSVAIHVFGSHGLRHFVSNDDVLSQ
jgi:hypothetical protein